MKLSDEFARFKNVCKTLDKKVITIFLSIAVLQTISWYHTSRLYFKSAGIIDFLGFSGVTELAEFLFWFIGDFIVFFIVPILIIKFYLKESFRSYGFDFSDARMGMIIAIGAVLIMMPILWLTSASAEFSANYPHLQAAKLDWNVFIVYELGMMLYLFAWEFVWRGFMLFGLEERFGYYAIFIQMIPFVILHNGKPEIETFSAIIGAIFLGYLALRTKSFLYGFFIHFGIMFTIDIFSVLRFRLDIFDVIP